MEITSSVRKLFHARKVAFQKPEKEKKGRGNPN